MKFITALGRNVLLGSLVFLPTFLIIVPLESWLRGVPLEGRFTSHVGDALFLYVAFIVPVVMGVAVHTVFLRGVPAAWPLRRRRTIEVLLALLVPATIVLIGGVEGGALLLERYGATLVATIAYGICASCLGSPSCRSSQSFVLARQ